MDRTRGCVTYLDLRNYEGENGDIGKVLDNYVNNFMTVGE